MASLTRALSFDTLTRNIEHDIDEYVYFKNNEDFAASYVENFVNTLLHNEFIPDLLIETLHEMSIDENNRDKYNLKSDKYIRTTRGLKYAQDRFGYDGASLLSESLVDDINYPTEPKTKENYQDLIDNMDEDEIRRFITQNAVDYLLIDGLIDKVKSQNKYATRKLILEDRVERRNRRVEDEDYDDNRDVYIGNNKVKVRELKDTPLRLPAQKDTLKETAQEPKKQPFKTKTPKTYTSLFASDPLRVKRFQPVSNIKPMTKNKNDVVDKSKQNRQPIKPQSQPSNLNTHESRSYDRVTDHARRLVHSTGSRMSNSNNDELFNTDFLQNDKKPRQQEYKPVNTKISNTLAKNSVTRNPVRLRRF